MSRFSRAGGRIAGMEPTSARLEALNNPVARKIGLALVAGAVAFGVTNLSDLPLSAVLTLTVLIGGITLLAQFLSSFEKRLTSLEERQADGVRQVRVVITGEIARINEATRLYDEISRLSPPVFSAERLGTVAAALAGMKRSLAFEVVQAEIDTALRLAERLSHDGEVSYDGEDRDWLWTLTLNAKTSIDATSRASRLADGSFADEGFWNSEIGVRYLEWQRQAVERGVRVRRIFVLDAAAAATDPAIRHVLREQVNAGIDARVLDASTLPAARRLLIPDIVVFDQELSYELTPGSKIGADAVPYFVATRLVTEAEAVAKRVRGFDELWALSGPA
jgi:hypothetical protein